MPERLSFYKWPLFLIFAICGSTSVAFLVYVAAAPSEVFIGRFCTVAGAFGLLAWAAMVYLGMFDPENDDAP